MARHYDKEIDAAKAFVDVRKRQARREPMSRTQIESFIKGFGLSAKATRQIVDVWDADTTNWNSAGYDSGYADATEY